jgi:hypothetical protein
MIKQKLKLQVPRWLGSAAAAVLLATAAHAQDSLVNIQASGIYEGGNTVIGGIPFTNGASFTETFSLYFDNLGVFSPSQTAVGNATEVITIGSTTYNYSLSAVGINYGHGGSGSSGYTFFGLFANGNSSPLAFGFDITLNTNLFSGIGNTLTLDNLAPILNTFQSAIDNGNNPPLLNMSYTDIYANNNDYGSTILTAQPAPEPSTLALAGLGSLSLLLFRRRK